MIWGLNWYFLLMIGFLSVFFYDKFVLVVFGLAHYIDWEVPFDIVEEGDGIVGFKIWVFFGWSWSLID